MGIEAYNCFFPNRKIKFDCGQISLNFDYLPVPFTGSTTECALARLGF